MQYNSRVSDESTAGRRVAIPVYFERRHVGNVGLPECSPLTSRQGRIPHDAFDGEEKVPVLGDEHPVVAGEEEEDLDPAYSGSDAKDA